MATAMSGSVNRLPTSSRNIVGGNGAQPQSSGAEDIPSEGERTIYVSDDGLLDTGEFDQLSAEFRHRLGLLPDEQQELSEVFKVRIGMASADQEQFDRLADEIDRAMSDGGQRRVDTIKKNNMEIFARKYFQPGSPPLQYNTKPLQRPLLPKANDIEKRASLVLWTAIKRFMDGASQRKASSTSKGLEVPIISRVWDQLETAPSTNLDVKKIMGSSSVRRNSANALASSLSSSADKNSVSGRKSLSASSSKRLSLRKLFRTNSSNATGTVSAAGGADYIRDSVSVASSTSSSSEGSSALPPLGEESKAAANGELEDNTGLLSSDIVDVIPNTELDLVNFIVAHGILRKQLRDEIFCQLCCQVTKNTSAESRRRGWILHALCSGCFLPSIELFSYYYGFLYDVLLSDTLHYAAYTRRILRRTSSNGLRFHPPSSVELTALKDQKALILEVNVADGRQVLIEGDSATTSSEVCSGIANMLQIKDSFGFALFININGKVSSLGNGLDHVMDAITECEQLVRSQGRLESTAAWKLSYQKEIFTPWYSPSNDQVATELIFRQIASGVHRDEYKLHEDDVTTFVARCLYVDHGRQLTFDITKSRMADYFPKSYLVNNNKSRDAVAKAVMAAFESQGFSGYAVPAKFIQQEIVANASAIWPIHFSAMFEAYRVDGPPLAQNDVVLAINSGGIFLLDSKYDVMVGFHYYDLMEAVAFRAAEIRQASVKLVAIDGAEFTFLSPNSETIARITTVFLEGLRRRSRWAVVTRKLDNEGGNQQSLKPGDLIEIDGTQQPPTSREEEWFEGRNDRTGDKGRFPVANMYILPTIEKPGPEYMNLLASLAQDRASAEPQRPVHPVTDAVGVSATPSVVNRFIIQPDDNNIHGSESVA